MCICDRARTLRGEGGRGVVAVAGQQTAVALPVLLHDSIARNLWGETVEEGGREQ